MILWTDNNMLDTWQESCEDETLFLRPKDAELIYDPLYMRSITEDQVTSLLAHEQAVNLYVG